MKNRNNRNSGFTLMELLVGIALVVVIAFFGMKLMGAANPEGWETVEVAQVLTGEEGAYALTKEGVAIPIAKALDGKIKAGENRVQITKSPEGLKVITGFKSSEGEETTVAPASAADQKKSLTQAHPIQLTAETLALAIGFLALGLTVGVFLLVRSLRGRTTPSPSPSQSDKPAEVEAVPAVQAKVTAPSAPPAAAPKTALEAAFQKAETAA